MSKKWEYLVDSDLAEHGLNDLGKLGWELVTVQTVTWENERKGYKEEKTYYYFKKEVGSNRG